MKLRKRCAESNFLNNDTSFLADCFFSDSSSSSDEEMKEPDDKGASNQSKSQQQSTASHQSNVELSPHKTESGDPLCQENIAQRKPQPLHSSSSSSFDDSKGILSKSDALLQESKNSSVLSSDSVPENKLLPLSPKRSFESPREKLNGASAANSPHLSPEKKDNSDTSPHAKRPQQKRRRLSASSSSSESDIIPNTSDPVFEESESRSVLPSQSVLESKSLSLSPSRSFLSQSEQRSAGSDGSVGNSLHLSPEKTDDGDTYPHEKLPQRKRRRLRLSTSSSSGEFESMPNNSDPLFQEIESSSVPRSYSLQKSRSLSVTPARISDSCDGVDEIENMRDATRVSVLDHTEQSPFTLNMFFLLSKYGSRMKNKHVPRSLPEKRSCEESWYLCHVAEDFSPWLIKDNGDAKACVMALVSLHNKAEPTAKVLECAVQEKLKWLDEVSGPTLFKTFQKEEFNRYCQNKFLNLQRKSDAVLPNVRKGMRLLLWQKNSCALDTIIALIPQLASLAIEKHLYACLGAGDVSTFTLTATAVVVQCLSLLEGRLESEVKLRSSYIRFLVQDYYTFYENKCPHMHISWSPFNQKQPYMDINEVFDHYVPLLLGNQYMCNGKKVISTFPLRHIDLRWAEKENIEFDTPSEFLQVLLSLRYRTNMESGFYRLSCTLLHSEQNISFIKKSSIWKSFIASLKENKEFSFLSSSNNNFVAQVVAVYGFTDHKTRNHFSCFIINPSSNGQEWFVYDGMASKGCLKSISSNQLFHLANSYLDLLDATFVMLVWSSESFY